MKIALVMNENSYAGREYGSALMNSSIKFDVISIGKFPPWNEIEEKRCGGLWKPLPFTELLKKVACHSFDSLNSPGLIGFLEREQYDLGIQGGTGILKPSIFTKFKLGILNFHPGDLPRYRGCSAPEWQVYEDQPVVSTCHLIDTGVDTGEIYSKKILPVDRPDYYHLRASIYPLTAQFVVEVIKEMINHNGFAHRLEKQDETIAVYRKYIGDKIINHFINSL